MSRSGAPAGLPGRPVTTSSGVPSELLGVPLGTPFGLVTGSLDTGAGQLGMPSESVTRSAGLPAWSSRSTQTLPFERGPSRSVSNSPRSIIRLIVEIDTPNWSAAATLLYRRLLKFCSPVGHGIPHGNPWAAVVAHVEADGVWAVCSGRWGGPGDGPGPWPLRRDPHSAGALVRLVDAGGRSCTGSEELQGLLAVTAVTEDLSEMEADDWDFIKVAASSQASVAIPPDLSGISDREILVKRTGAIR